MGFLGIFPFLIILVYLAILAAFLYMIYLWVNRFISLKQEHNNLLRKIIQKMDQKEKMG